MFRVLLTNTVLIKDARTFPIRRIEFTTPTDERKRFAGEAKAEAEEAVQALSTSGVVGSSSPLDRAVLLSAASPALKLVEEQLAAQPEQSDVVHDLLAHLAEQMIEMNKEKQGHLKAFRLDLAGYLDERQQNKLNRLYTPKKSPQEGARNYPQRLTAYEQAVALAQAQIGPLAGETLALEDFWRLNQAQWVWLLRQNLGQVDQMSKLVVLYERYHAQLAPLMRRLQRTDWLIDQVVYQLYGLTEEEIAIVEGR
jgi:hypothetical protein